MSFSVVFWIVVAVLPFWAMGGYNRLVRLRSEANAAFAALETALGKQVALVQACLPPDDTPPGSLFEAEASFWSSLQGAATQLAASLAAARPRPLEPERIAALSAAQDVLAMAWSRAERDDAHDLAGARLPETVTATRAQLLAQSSVAVGHFNVAVARYNEAIAQFPALLLAWLFGFRAGRGI